jgi:hypothetical protein
MWDSNAFSDNEGDGFYKEKLEFNTTNEVC